MIFPLGQRSGTDATSDNQIEACSLRSVSVSVECSAVHLTTIDRDCRLQEMKMIRRFARSGRSYFLSQQLSRFLFLDPSQI